MAGDDPLLTDLDVDEAAATVILLHFIVVDEVVRA